MSFGNYDPLADTDVDAIGQVIYTCEKGGGPGTTGGGRITRHPHRDGAGLLELVRPACDVGASRRAIWNTTSISTRLIGQVWGTGEGPTLAYVDSNPPNGTPVTVPAFGRIFGGQDVPAGPYTDTVPVRILF